MTLLHILHRNKYKCDSCGHIGFWDSNWIQYSSIAMQEACPGDIPTACSEKCMEDIIKKMASGEIKLPKIKADAGGFRALTDRIGY